jgi:phage terminase Nu1 subunit (DNA packaging protein)
MVTDRFWNTRICAKFEKEKLMNKKEVSEFSGVSTRLVEKYASEGLLGEVTYIRGKTRKGLR